MTRSLMRFREHTVFDSVVPGLQVVAFLVLVILLVLLNPVLMRMEIESAKQDAVQRLSVYKTSLSATIDRHLYLPKILSSDPRIISALNPRSLERPDLYSAPYSNLLKTMNRQAESDQIFVMRPSGLTLYSSNYQSSDSFVGENYSYRPYFQDAMAGRLGLYFAVGATSGIPGFFRSAPVYSETDDILGVIVVKIDLSKLEHSWNQSGDSVWVTDEEGIIFLASDPKLHYRSLAPLSDALRSELEKTRQYGGDPVRPLERATQWQSDDWSTFHLGEAGAQLVFETAIEGYPWKMHMRIPLARVTSQVRWKQGAIGILYAAFVAGILFYRERRRRTLAQDALAKMTAARESHQRAIIQNTDVGLLNLDADFHPLFVNERAQALFRLVGDVDSVRPDRLLDPWEPGYAGGGSCRAEGIRSDGTRFPVFYTLNPIHVGDRKEFILTVQDITELTSAQRALQEINRDLEHRVEERTRDLEDAQAALAQNQKLAALGRMSAALAHEINQPITALSNYVASSQILLERNRLDDVHTNFQKIEDLLARLSRLSRQLRIFAGKRNSGSAPISMLAPVHYAIELLKTRLEEEVIRFELIAPDDCRVQANTMVLEQIVVNLLTNAIDAVSGQEDGRIIVRLDCSGAQPGQAVLNIEDNGHGMTKEQMSQVFEPFYTTKPMGKGLGLGLAISYSLALDLGGDLTVHSRLNEGTRFSLNLPITSATESGDSHE